VITVAGRIIADSRNVLLLREASYPPVPYFPREDVAMDLLTRSTTKTYCPYKGEASYFSIAPGGARSIDGVWSYEAPFEAVAAISNHLAFYPDRVDEIREES
jgi:uncharacterized protein (DUF427 family)